MILALWIWNAARAGVGGGIQKRAHKNGLRCTLEKGWELFCVMFVLRGVTSTEEQDRTLKTHIVRVKRRHSENDAEKEEKEDVKYTITNYQCGNAPRNITYPTAPITIRTINHISTTYAR